jgi:16S rRNA (guanine527-N7)-methyltransferase
MTDEARTFAEQFDVSRETLDRLTAYEALLKKWTPKINLVASGTLKDLWSRHFMDSAQLLALAPRVSHWVDLGSGGGFPGLVVAAMTRDAPGTRYTLVESDQRKATFLRTVIRELGLTAEVVANRIEDIAPLHADVLSARALAPLTDLLAFTEQHRQPGGRSIFPKGENVDKEIAVALERWRFDCEKHRSITDANSTILCIGELQRV